MEDKPGDEDAKVQQVELITPPQPKVVGGQGVVGNAPGLQAHINTRQPALVWNQATDVARHSIT
jgi:hypothetical protein